LYNKYRDKEFDSKKLEEEITKLMQDEDVTKKSGIYSYILTRNEKYLSIRTFTDKQKREAYEKQEGICVKCEGNFEIAEMEADHIKPWHE
jgi:predicted SprT family Zn-dependent metalloprotease